MLNTRKFHLYKDIYCLSTVHANNDEGKRKKMHSAEIIEIVVKREENAKIPVRMAKGKNVTST